jgi:hypothetical protein
MKERGRDRAFPGLKGETWGTPAPIWTEDQDFFGSGVATWTSGRIEVYLRDS